MTEHAPRNPIAQVLEQATQTLEAVGCDTPRLDAEVLLAHVSSQGRAWLYAHPEHILPPPQLSAYQALIARRARREPVAYLTGYKEFYGLDFIVTPDVLIPRPETERLIELALQWGGGSSSAGLIADVGAGSGAIAVTLALHLPRTRIIAIDSSSAALSVARRNVVRHGATGRVHCVQGDLLAPLAAGALHLIVANPPYLSQAELATAPPEVACWEPRVALEGGPDGLKVIRHLLEMAPIRLHPGGGLLVEIGAAQGSKVLVLARRRFPRASVEIAKDYTGDDRLLIVRNAQ